MAHPGSGGHDCTLCQEDEKTNIAVRWCIECETFLCKDCDKTHGRIKSSKNHHTTSVESFNELPDFVTKINNNCGDHGKRFDAYCLDHTVACCVDCVLEDHKICKNVQNITEVLKGFKASSSVYHIERNLSDILENFKTIEKYLATRLATVDIQKANAEKEIKAEKQRIIDHLNMIEKRFLDNMKLKHANIRTTIEELQKQVQVKKTEIEQLHTDYTKMKEFATELQMFEGIKEIEKLTTEHTQYINDCTAKGLLNDTDLKVELSPLVKSVSTDLVSFGNISASVNKSSLKLKQGEGQQVRRDCLIKPTIDQIKPKIKKVLDLPQDQYICGCQILPNERMVFVNFPMTTLMLYSKEGNYVKDVVTFPKILTVYDVTFIRDNVVAVTSYQDVRVFFVDIESNKIIKTINVKEKVWGIDNDGFTIRLTTGNSKTIINLNHDGEILSHQSIEENALFIATFEDNIYVSENWDDKISCYEKNGSLLWTFSSDEVRGAFGISVDKHGFVYVAGCVSNNVIVVSPDGKQHKTILNNNDGISRPMGLSIDRKTSTLLVANRDDGKGHLLKLY